MHWIKLYILDKLLSNEHVRNKDLRPPRVESNLFQYHLKELIKTGYVDKCHAGYTLASLGLQWADGYSGQLKAVRPQSKFITILALKNEFNEYLLIPKLRQPFVSKLYFPSGKIRQGEAVTDAARRELVEKVGVSDVELIQRGSVRICVTRDDFVVSDFLGYIFMGSTARDSVRVSGSSWDSTCDSTKDHAPGNTVIMQCIQSGVPFLESFIKL